MLDLAGAVGHQGSCLAWQGAAVERLDARAEALEMGIELDRPAGEDQHGLEDAPAGIGMGRC